MIRILSTIQTLISRPDETADYTPLPITTWEMIAVIYAAVQIYTLTGGTF